MNHELLTEFTAFCHAHPELTFWRALLQWIQEKHDNQFTNILVLKSSERLYDTSEWTGEDKPEILFAREFRDDKK